MRLRARRHLPGSSGCLRELLVPLRVRDRRVTETLATDGSEAAYQPARPRRPLCRLVARKPPFRFRPRPAARLLRAHPGRSRFLMLRSKPDVRSGGGFRLIEALLELPQSGL